MASTHKTAALFLNKWLGTDKPKKDDFNTDNEKVDAAFGGLSARMQSSEERMGALESHAKSSALHVTAEEKEQWGNASAVETGSYAGSGTSTRTIELGFQPRFGAVFAIGKNAVDGDWNTGECNVYAGFFSAEGCSGSVALTSTGFTVQHQASRPMNGAAVRMNQTGVQYAYVAWR